MSPAARLRLPGHRRVQFQNGLQVLLVADGRLPAIAVSLVLRGGAATDNQGQEGCAALTMSLLNQGSSRRDARSLAEAVDELGATLSASAGWDSTAVSLYGLSEDTGALVDLLAEITMDATIPDDQFTAMRDRQMHRLARSLDSPATLADWTLSRHLYSGHPYGHPRSGTGHSVSALTAGDCRAHHRRQKVPALSYLAVAGDLDPEPMLAHLSDRFGTWTRSGDAAPEAPRPAPPRSGRRLILVDRPELTQAQIRWGHAGVARNDAEHDAVQVMNYTLGGGGFSSRLMQRIRSERGLTYGISSGFDARLVPGPFVISTFTPTVSVVDVLNEIDALVTVYRDEGPTETELEAARQRCIGGYPLRFETPSQVANHILEADLYGLPADGLESYPERIASLTTAQMQTLARQHLRPEEALMVVVGPAAELLPALQPLGTVETFDPGIFARRAG